MLQVTADFLKAHPDAASLSARLGYLGAGEGGRARGRRRLRELDDGPGRAARGRLPGRHEHPRDAHHDPHHGALRVGHQGVHALQQRHRRREDRPPPRRHRDRRVLREARELPPVRAERPQGHPGGRRDHLLRLHRLRRRLDDGRGDARTRGATCRAASSGASRSAPSSTSASARSCSGMLPYTALPRRRGPDRPRVLVDRDEQGRRDRVDRRRRRAVAARSSSSSSRSRASSWSWRATASSRAGSRRSGPRGTPRERDVGDGRPRRSCPRAS